MACDIRWNALSIEGWEERFSKIARSNFLQSYTYAKAHCPLAKQKARWGLILIDGKEAGLVQLFEAGILWNLFHAVIVDRGPLWFDGFGNAMHIKRFYEALNRKFPARRGRRRRIIPEIQDGPAARKLIEGQGFKRSDAHEGYATVWLDLTRDEDTLRANLKSNWRNKLSKAEKAQLHIDDRADARILEGVAGLYAADKSVRGYAGPSPALLRDYGRLLLPKDQILILRALENDAVMAFTVFIVHGRSATYFAGWSSQDGRDRAAHHLLLWNGMLRLKAAGVKELDLGGVHKDGSGEGIKTFKEGLGGEFYQTVGLYS